MKTNLDNLRAQVATARREWIELDPAVTSYAMRHKAEQRYLSLKRLLAAATKPAPVVNAGTPPRTASRWQALAARA